MYLYIAEQLYYLPGYKMLPWDMFFYYLLKVKDSRKF